MNLNVDAFGHFLHLLSQKATAPMLIHCAVGRDRSGVSVALIQKVLDVSDDNTATFYGKTGALHAVSWATGIENPLNVYGFTIEELF